MSTEFNPCEPNDFGDPDVSGFGVLISFGISILMMLGTIITGYFQGLLREDRYNEVDAMIIGTFHRVLHGKRTFQKSKMNQRIYHFENLVLTMSDQQLITGFSLILAAQLIRYGIAGLDKTISTYSYCMAVNLGLFSCVTHLSSMTVLRNHYDSNKRLRDTKTLLMLASLGLLIPQLLAAQTLNTKPTLRCSLDYIGGDTGLHWYGDTYSKMIFFETLSMIGIIVCGYLRRIMELYILKFRESPEAWVADVLSRTLSWPSKDDMDTFNNNAHADRFAEAMSLLIGRNGLGRYFTLFSIVLGELRSSFFAEMVWFFFYSTFALCQVCFFIVWGGGDLGSSISFTPQFGQILSLGMLAIPALSIIETYRRLEPEKVELCLGPSQTRCPNGGINHSLSHFASQETLVEGHGSRSCSSAITQQSDVITRKASQWIFVAEALVEGISRRNFRCFAKY